MPSGCDPSRGRQNDSRLSLHRAPKNAVAMTPHQTELVVQTRGRGFHEITREVTDWVRSTGIQTGLCTLFLRHTSASLVIRRMPIPTSVGTSTPTSPTWCPTAGAGSSIPPRATTTCPPTSSPP